MKLLGIFLTLCVFQTNGFHKFHCNGHVGVLPDPANCQCFYICNFDEAVHECCNREELFDAKFLVCNHEYLVDCHERPEPGESTTRKTTTTTPTTTTTTPTTTTTTTPKPQNPKSII